MAYTIEILTLSLILLLMENLSVADTMDFSQVSLTQAKRMEMNSQVRVLQLENDLEKERVKLAELRKKHYQLAGESEGWEVEVSIVTIFTILC